ncbi:hypothetical protein [Agarivorans gilvus]|uniref:Beta-ketoacyl synthase N-terminal domain-containing protein n=1 Tax=Agarivorans gilvus TaxID=680279 RepID=A0ABQ1I3E2_9ALTE|nr:hypothetical protein [Agarivorans gilvus]GGB12841.1 hypothetical protein GCM10007414_27710 [Agarivorans gilvus]
MIYVQRCSGINLRQDDQLNIKAECKKVAPAYVRRTDRFIQLGILGIAGLAQQGALEPNTPLIMTSGQGNLAVFKRLCVQRYVEQVPPNPVDFINSLSNTAGFYIAKYLGLASKNLNLAQQGFVVENALLLAKAHLDSGQYSQLLLGGVDEKPEADSLPHRYLDLDPKQAIGEGANWLLLSAHEQGAIATIELVIETFSLAEILVYLAEYANFEQLAFSQRIPLECVKQLSQTLAKPLFNCQDNYDFYETNILFVMNSFIRQGSGRLAYIDYFSGDYRVVWIRSTR